MHAPLPLSLLLALLLLVSPPALGAAVPAAGVPVPRSSGACNLSCPASSRSKHVLVNTARQGTLMECYYDGHGMCAYNTNTGKLKKGKSTGADCRPNAIISCKRKSKAKGGNKKPAPPQAQAGQAVLIQRAGSRDGSEGIRHRDYET